MKEKIDNSVKFQLGLKNRKQYYTRVSNKVKVHFSMTGRWVIVIENTPRPEYQMFTEFMMLGRKTRILTCDLITWLHPCIDCNGDKIPVDSSTGVKLPKYREKCK